MSLWDDATEAAGFAAAAGRWVELAAPELLRVSPKKAPAVWLGPKDDMWVVVPYDDAVVVLGNCPPAHVLRVLEVLRDVEGNPITDLDAIAPPREEARTRPLPEQPCASCSPSSP